MTSRFLPGTTSSFELTELASPFPKPGWTQGFGFYEWRKPQPTFHYADVVSWFFETCPALLQKVSWNNQWVEGGTKKDNTTRWRSGHLINLYKLRTNSRSGFLKDAHVICCMELEPDAWMPWTDWVVFCRIEQDGSPYYPDRNCFFGVRAERGWLKREEQIELARRFASVFGSCYGIAYYRPHHYGPYQYVYGGSQLEPNDKMTEDEYGFMLVKDAQRRRRWNIQDRAFPAAEGYFRDIYPMSFLPEAHLKAPIEGTTFEAWQQRSGIGTLTEILPGFAAWEVPREHEEEAREVLKRNNRLLQYIDKTR